MIADRLGGASLLTFEAFRAQASSLIQDHMQQLRVIMDHRWIDWTGLLTPTLFSLTLATGYLDPFRDG